jgi:hypothetical protein
MRCVLRVSEREVYRGRRQAGLEEIRGCIIEGLW